MRTPRTTHRIGRAIAALLWLLECSLLPSGRAWAQRGPDEPVANPQFQQQVQGGGSPGAPLPPGGDPSAAPSDPGLPPGGGGAGEEGYPPRNLQAVQIGPAVPRRAAPDVPSNPLETRIVVRVKNAPLATFLDTISAQAKVNFIITEGLEEKRVTAFLQNVTVREALQILLEIKGLTYQRIGKSNTYVVSPRSKDIPNRITRIYTLSYIPLVPIQAGSPNLSLQSLNVGGAQMLAQASQEGAQPQGGQNFQAPPGTGQAPGAAGAATDGPVAIINVLRSVLSRAYGTIAVDARTNSVIITDIPEVFPQVEQILAELDRKAPQVIIEAQIVEIDSDRQHQLGLEWGGSAGELASFAGPKRDTTFPLALPKKLSNTHFFDPVSNTISGLAAGGSGGQQPTASSATDLLTAAANLGSTLQTGVVDLSRLTILLRALVTRSEARFLGKPKVMTLNNKAAAITISRAEAVAINTTQSGQAGGTTLSQAIERYQTGLILKVTPQVNREGFITLLLEPSFTDVTESSVSSAANRIFDPISRTAVTLVRVKNGQTLVLGGLLQSRETKAVRKVPFLGYIPVLGWLFTSTSSKRINTDLVIFITPTVVND